MKKGYLKLIFLLIISVLLVGCGNVDASGIQEENNAFKTAGLKVVNTKIDLKVGKLNINNSNDNNINSRINFNNTKWKPVIKHMKDSYGGYINISQFGVRNVTESSKSINSLDLSFSKSVPINMKIKAGVSDVKADLSKLQLSNLDINMGNGNLYLNVAGNYKKNVSIDLSCGVGESTIYFPKNVGVRVEVEKHSDQCAISLAGLTGDGDIYTNSNYGKSNVSVYAKISENAGKINLNVE